jgi:AbrB family looped-hinge helix DNA binding protein
MSNPPLQAREPTARFGHRPQAGSASAGDAPAPARVAQAVVSSKGQVTLPAALRAALGIGPGSHIRFELRGRELVIRPELPITAYYGLLEGHDLGDTEPEKEPDREFG